MRIPNALRIARIHWTAGNPLPLDIEVELMALGLDVPTLHRNFINRRTTRIG